MAHQEVKELFSLLSWHMHREDKSPLDTLHRLIQKCVPSEELAPFKVTERFLYVSYILRQCVLNGNTEEPRNIVAPLILFKHRKKIYLIDGQKRLTRLAKEQVVKVRCLVIRYS